jgi:signal peptidase I
MNRELILQIATLLSYAAGPVALICSVDDWYLRPQRRLAALPAVAADPMWLKILYNILPILIIGTVLRIVLSERMDFSLVLVSVIAVAALVWLFDKFVLAPSRRRTAAARGVDAAAVPLPVTVDYAHSFLPVFAIVLVVRSFIFEPFRIPSDSMMPTLQDGDLIAVNKFAYGLRLPVLNNKLVSIGEPQRGDVVVFRYPPDPAINYIKRLVGLPGDRVAVKDDQLTINGQLVPFEANDRYNDGCYANMRIASEQLGAHKHRVLSCRTPGSLAAPPLAGCSRWTDHSYQCGEPDAPGIPDSGDFPESVVPAGSYLMMGDNRDNSADGRFWGYVPEANLVGRASRIWFNWDLQRSGGPVWSRIGSKIE